ncbi:O-antigen ligase family protein [Caldisericum sp.]|uniref:O-antigen ligase family protein n=1 Tax=Caldisericum sp. TaxID=2499687 RepID=UPI003D09E3A3
MSLAREVMIKKSFRLMIFLAYYLSFAFVFAVLNFNLIKIPIPFLNFFELLVIPILIVMFPFIKSISKYEKVLYGSIFLIILIRLISIFFAEYFRLDQLISVMRFFEYIFIICIVSTLLRDAKTQGYFVKGVMVFTFLETVMGITVFLMSRGHFRGYFFTNGIYIQQIFVLLIALGNILYGQKYKYFWGFLSLIMFLGIITAEIRIGYMDLLIALFLYLIFAEYKTRLAKMLLLVLLVFLPLISLLYFKGYLNVVEIRITQAFKGEGTVLVRAALWTLAWRLFLSHPFTGIGTGGFARFQEQYLASLGLTLPEEYIGLSTHNTVLGILAETGIIGFIAYLVYVFVVFKIFRLLIKLYYLELNYDKKIYAISVGICLVIVILMDWFAQGSFSQGAAVLLGFALGILKEKNRSLGGSKDGFES